MGFFDFFKKKKEVIPDIRRISLQELADELEQEKEKHRKENGEFEGRVLEQVRELIPELKDKLSGLRTVKIREKEDERIKLIVRENLYFYTTYLEKLIRGLEEIEKKPVENCLERVNSIFFGFEKNSGKSFEKATILVGKELGEVRKAIRMFFQRINEDLNNHKESLEKRRLVDSVINILSDKGEVSRAIVEITKSIHDAESERTNIEAERENAEKEIEKWSKSEEFRKQEEERRKTEEEKEKVRGEISKMKERMNLKELMKIHHTDGRKADLIKKYQENFISALEDDEHLEIAGFSGMKDELERMREKNGRLKSAEKSRRNDFEEKLRKIKLDLLEIEKKIEDEKRKLARFQDKEEALLLEIEEKARDVFGNIEVKA